MRGRSLLVFTAASLVACNAILGVEEVRLRNARTLGGGGDSGDRPPDDGEEDASRPTQDRGKLALGTLFACARKPTNSVVCWGDNGAGQLADGLPFDSATRLRAALKPVEVQGLTDVVDIAAGLGHACVALKNGTARCWGLNSFGQLGNGTTERSSSPVEVLDLTDVASLAGGQSFTCAVLRNKTAKCWGGGYSRQLGNGETMSRSRPVDVQGLADVVAISGGTDHACAVLEGGSLACWGANTFGQLGNGTTNELRLPETLTTLSDVAQVAASARFTCARQNSGRVYCWGNNELGQLGTGSTSTSANPSPNVVVSVSDAQFLWTGLDHACAVRRSGNVVCWGKGQDGQLGTGDRPDGAVPRPSDVERISGARAVWTAGDRSCALLDEGRAYCWGANSLGQLGNGTDQPSFTPVPVSNFP